jgi:DNA-binding MarR family transcriptional regulator
MSTIKSPPVQSSPSEPCPWIDIGPDTPPLELDDYPISMLIRVVSVVQKEITSVYAKQHGLSLPEWRLLARLAKNAPMQLSALCKVSFFDKAQAGRVLRALEGRDLVSMKVDENHKRRIVVDVTAHGRSIAEHIFPIAEREQMELLEVLDVSERKAMYAGLKKLLKAMNVTNPKRP